jgi:superfamily II DNA or RNA helicase
MNKITILNNKECQLFSDDEKLIAKVKRFLSFRAEGVEFTPAYQNGWNGITYLLTKQNKFNFGLLKKVKDFLTENHYEFEINDLRKSIQINQSIDISTRLKELGMIPREHQERILKATDQNNFGIIKSSTGSGKSLIAAMIVAKKNESAIIHVIGSDLLDQFHKLFSKIFNESIGVVGGGICRIERITIASVWTTAKSIDPKLKKISEDDETDYSEQELNVQNKLKLLEHLKKVKLHIFDESHVATCETLGKIYSVINPDYMYGLSGSPFTYSNSDLLIESFFGQQIIDVPASELIQKGLLATPIIKFVSVPKMSNPGTKYLEVYKNYIVENEVRNNLIIKSTKNLLDKKYVPLLLFRQIKHGKILAEKLDEAGISYGLLSGADNIEKRNEIKRQLVSGEIQCIVASVVFDIGIDLPTLSGLVLCGGGKSYVKTIQRIGRINRYLPGKKYAAVVEFFDQVKYLKNHSLKRAEIYKTEDAFKVIKCAGMK